MTELPPGWAIAELQEIAEVRLGRQRSPDRATGERMRPYLRAANVGWRGLKFDDVKEMAFTERESETYELRRGDILMAEASGSPGEVGKPGIYNGELEGCCFQNTLMRVRLMPEFSSSFFEFFLREQALNGRFAAGSRGVGIHHLGAAALSVWPVPVVPFCEQNRIVEAIEESFSKLDAGEAALRTTRQKLKRMRDAILSAAVTGQLVPQDPTDTPACKFVTNPLSATDGTTLPSSWSWARLAEVAEVRLGRQRSPDRAQGERMRPYLRAANVTWKGLALADVNEMAFTEAESKVFELEVGDILLSEASGSPGEVGKPGQYRGEIPGCCFQNTLLRVRFPPPFDPDFFEHYLRHQASTGRFAAGSRGVGIHHLGAKALSDWPVPIPPPQQQRRIVNEVDRYLSVIDACDRAVDAGLTLSAALRRSVLKAAFEGRLAPQDPSDEPASVLLERIRADRVASGPAKSGRGRKKVETS